MDWLTTDPAETSRWIRLLFVGSFLAWAGWGIRRGWSRFAWLLNLWFVFLAWLATNGPLARIYGLIIPGDRQRNLSWAMSTAAGNHPFENPILGHSVLEPIFSATVALASGFEPERVLRIYPYISLVVSFLVTAAVYWAFVQQPREELRIDEKWQRALIVVFFVLFVATPVFDWLGPYRGYWSRNILLKPSHFVGAAFTVAFVHFFSRRSYFVSLFILSVLGWWFVVHWGFIGLSLGVYFVWNGLRTNSWLRGESAKTLMVGASSFVLVSPWLWLLSTRFPAAVTLSPGWQVSSGEVSVGVSNWGDVMPSASSLFFLVTLDQGALFVLGFVGFWTWCRRASRDDLLWASSLVALYGVFVLNYVLYLNSVARESDEIYYFLVFLLSVSAGEGAFQLYRFTAAFVSRNSNGQVRPHVVFGAFLLALLPLATPYWWRPPVMDVLYRQSLQPIPEQILSLGEWLRSNTQGKDLVVAADAVAHWAPVISGRRVAYLQVDLRDALSEKVRRGDSTRDCSLPLAGIEGRRLVIAWDSALTAQLGLEEKPEAHPCWEPVGSLHVMELFEWFPARRVDGS